MIWWEKLSQPDLSIIFPAYNEAENILESIQQALPFVDSHNAEIIIVDDGSQDNTAQLVANFAHVSVRLLQHETNRGYGAALRTGFLHARGTWVFFTDADLQFDLQELHDFWKHIENFDIVIGYRFLRRDPLHRRIYAKIWCFLVNQKLGLSIRDVNCAFKLIRKDVLREIHLHAQGASVNAELLYYLRNVRLLQLPVIHKARIRGEQSGAKIHVIMRALLELIRL